VVLVSLKVQFLLLAAVLEFLVDQCVYLAVVLDFQAESLEFQEVALGHLEVATGSLSDLYLGVHLRF
jgi:hypothetical protein